MKIRVIPFAAAAEQVNLKDRTVVVIDVLRATSVMIEALHNGAREIIPCLTVDEALQRSSRLKKGTFLLCGERDALKIEGFDLGNSPLEYTRERVGGKTLLLTTTNGTRALMASRQAANVMAGAFLNMQAVVRAVRKLDELVLCCAGTAGNFSLDDGMCAAMIMDELSGLQTIETDDLGHLLLHTYLSSDRDYVDILQDCRHLRELKNKGFEADIHHCLSMMNYKFVPRFIEDSIIISDNS